MRFLKSSLKVILRIVVIVIIGGLTISSLMDFTYSAFISNSPNLKITINENGSISSDGNLFDGQLYPATEEDAKNGIGGITGIIRIENNFRKIDVDNLAIGVSDIEIGNNFTDEYVLNSFLNNVRLKVEKGQLLTFKCAQHGRQLDGESPLWGLVVATISQEQGCPSRGGI